MALRVENSVALVRLTHDALNHSNGHHTPIYAMLRPATRIEHPPTLLVVAGSSAMPLLGVAFDELERCVSSRANVAPVHASSSLAPRRGRPPADPVDESGQPTVSKAALAQRRRRARLALAAGKVPRSMLSAPVAPLSTSLRVDVVPAMQPGGSVPRRPLQAIDAVVRALDGKSVAALRRRAFGAAEQSLKQAAAARAWPELAAVADTARRTFHGTRRRDGGVSGPARRRRSAAADASPTSIITLTWSATKRWQQQQRRAAAAAAANSAANDDDDDDEAVANVIANALTATADVAAKPMPVSQLPKAVVSITAPSWRCRGCVASFETRQQMRQHHRSCRAYSALVRRHPDVEAGQARQDAKIGNNDEDDDDDDEDDDDEDEEEDDEDDEEEDDDNDDDEDDEDDDEHDIGDDVVDDEEEKVQTDLINDDEEEDDEEADDIEDEDDVDVVDDDDDDDDDDRSGEANLLGFLQKQSSQPTQVQPAAIIATQPLVLFQLCC
jgi:hypothetical protein